MRVMDTFKYVDDDVIVKRFAGYDSRFLRWAFYGLGVGWVPLMAAGMIAVPATGGWSSLVGLAASGLSVLGAWGVCSFVRARFRKQLANMPEGEAHKWRVRGTFDELGGGLSASLVNHPDEVVAKAAVSEIKYEAYGCDAGVVDVALAKARSGFRGTISQLVEASKSAALVSLDATSGEGEVSLRGRVNALLSAVEVALGQLPEGVRGEVVDDFECLRNQVVEDLDVFERSGFLKEDELTAPRFVKLEEQVRADVASLVVLLDRLDEMVAAGRVDYGARVVGTLGVLKEASSSLHGGLKA